MESYKLEVLSFKWGVVDGKLGPEQPGLDLIFRKPGSGNEIIRLPILTISMSEKPVK